jgi:pimeloyl-ACP methyl ester carboxylesterase
MHLAQRTRDEKHWGAENRQPAAPQPDVELAAQPAAAPATQTAHLYGREIGYLRYGDTGPVVVLLHGLGGSARSWAASAPLLAQSYQVLAIDLGQVHAGHRSVDFGVAAAANVVRDLLKTLGIERAHFCGHSWGGGLAMQIAYQHPHLVETLVLVGTGGLGPEVALPLRLASSPLGAALLPLACGMTALPLRALINAAEGMPAVQEAWRRHHLDGLLPDLQRLRTASARQTFLATVRACIDWRGQRLDGREHLGDIARVPVLLVWGRHDPIVPLRHAVRAQQEHPELRLHVVEDSGHFPHATQPADFIDAVRSFVTEHAPASWAVAQATDPGATLEAA